MITISISGNTSQDIMKDFSELSNLLHKQTVSTVTATEVVEQTKEAFNEAVNTHNPLADGMIIKFTESLSEAIEKADTSSEEVKPAKRKRRTKAEIEAEQAAELAALKSEVAANHAAVEVPKFEVPAMPTTNVVVQIPKSDVAPVEEVKPAPVAPPTIPQLNTNNAYTIDTFKSGLVMILNNLLKEGKIDKAWIDATSTKVFEGKDIWDWNKNEAKVTELYNMFISWKFINAI